MRSDHAKPCSSGTNYASGFAYTPAGQITGFNYGNGVSAAFTYFSDRLQLQSLSYVKGAQTLSSLNYWYKTDATNCPSAPSGNNGQIQCIQDNVDTGRSATYTYDALYRLSTAVTTGSSAYPKWGLQESYDRYGNRSSQSIYSGCVAPMTCPTNSVTPDPATNRISGNCYDANGNLLAESAPPCPSPTYTYDAENHLVNYMSTNPTYTYDGNGLRVKKVSGSTTTVYIFSGSKVIAEYDNGAAPSAPSREYIYAGGALLAKFESSATIYYHPDHLSTRVLSDASGNILGQRGNFPFGEAWYETGTTTKLKFTSYERDAESGNDFAMARYYVNRLARFSALDPMSGSASAPQSLNRYSYVQNDPVNATDPTGMLMVFLPSESGGGGDDSDLNPNCPGDESWDIGWYAPCPNYPQNPTVRPDPSGGGGGGHDKTIERAKKVVAAILSDLTNDCSKFFNTATYPPDDPGLPKFEAKQIHSASDAWDWTRIQDVEDPSEIKTMTDKNAAAVSHYGSLQDGIGLNPEGAFYQPTGPHGGTYTVGPYKNGGNTLAGQVFILLHEFGHIVKLLPKDNPATPEGQKNEDDNNENLAKKCKDAIDATIASQVPR